MSGIERKICRRQVERRALVTCYLASTSAIFVAMIQGIIVVLIFVAALVYLGRLVLRNFTTKDSCASGCGKCGVDFSKIEKQLAQKK